MESIKDSIQQRLDKVRYNYQLFMHPEKIEISENLTDEEKKKQHTKIYRDKAKLHEKLGAKKFQKFVKKLDKAKYKVIKRLIKEDRVIKWSDKISESNAEQKLKKAKTKEEKSAIIEEMKRGKVLVRKQLKEERSINYYQGVDKRVEIFYKYIHRNKEIHKNALKLNGVLLGTSVALGLAGVPVLPFVLGGYQIFAGFKNFQCVNAQDYYLSIMNIRKKSIINRNLTKIKKTYEENPELLAELQTGLEKGNDLNSEQGLLDSINTVEGLQQLKARLIAAKKQQANIMESSTEKYEAILDKMITPSEQQRQTTAKVAVKK